VGGQPARRAGAMVDLRQLGEDFRPAVNFLKMADASTELTYVEKEKGQWVQHYADCALARLQSNCKSWQDGLVKAILDSFVRNTSVEAFAEMKAKLG
jgi:hypothetical protein